MKPGCYAFVAANPIGRRIVIVKRGEPGYHITTRDAAFIKPEKAKEIVDSLNQHLGVKPDEAAEMFAAATQDEEGEAA